MRNFRDISIQWKLTLFVMLTSSAALLLACTAFVAHELIMFRHTMASKLSTMAGIIGATSTAALSFNDQASAEEILAALRAQPNIVAAWIYTKDGSVFAQYQRRDMKGGIPPPAPQADSYRFGDDHLTVFHPIVLNDETIGAVYLQSDLQEMYSRMQRYVANVAVIMLASSFVAWMLSLKLQRVISVPILHLVQTARAVSVEKNYAVRAVKHNQDELGVLIDAFNEMLTQIQERDTALQKARDELERRVEERTKELQQEIIERWRADEAVQRFNEELEQRVRQRTAQLEATNHELEAFSYSVSHDLRAPLRSIDGFSHALLRRYIDKLDPRGQSYLQRIRAASQRMAQLIDDLLSLCHLTRIDIHREPVDLSALSRMIGTKLQQRQQRRHVEFVIADGLVVHADRRLLQVMLENLLGNAWKFTAKQPRARIEVGAIQHEGKEDKTVYFVHDNGAGFDMAYADKLFAPFQRLHTTAEFEGTGIGLATVQRIVHRHGGGIWAEGAVDQGATFYFTL